MSRSYLPGRPQGRHSLHTPSPRRPRSARVARLALVAVLSTTLTVGAGVSLSGASLPGPQDAGTSISAAQEPDHFEAARERAESREEAISRSAADRAALAPVVKRKLWTTADLDLRVQPREKARTVGLVKDQTRIGVTGERQGDYAEVVHRGVSRWVTASYLSKTKVVDPADRPLSNAPCPDGSSIEGGLQPQSVKVYRAVCAAFPELSAYGGQDGHGEHVNGEAIDFMVPSSSVGEQVKDFLYAHRSELDLFDIIWSQQIWTTQRSGEGFRGMSDRGSATANHYDHVHIKIN